MLVDVKESKFLRDTNSMALINKDTNAREDYYMRAKLLKTQKEEINSIKSEVSSLKDDVKQIKELLVQLLGKGSNG